MKRLLAVFLSFAALSLAAEAGSHLKGMQARWATSKKYTLAMAELMPAEHYGFKPVPEQMLHIAESNLHFFGAISGTKPPAPGPVNKGKATVLKALADSFDYSARVLDGLTETQLAKVVDLGEGPQGSAADGIMLALDHTTHHRGQTVVYLRLKGITPAEYQF